MGIVKFIILKGLWKRLKIEMKQRKKRYCVLCGRRLKTGLKYCYECKNPTRRKIEGSIWPLFVMGFILIAFIFIIVSEFISWIEANPLKTIFCFLFTALIVGGILCSLRKRKQNKDTQKTNT